MFNYVLLLRGINVGGKGLLPMQSLRDMLADLGYTNVSTYIQSGNAVLTSKRLLNTEDEAILQQEIFKVHGFSPTVMFLAASVFQEALACCPFDLTESKAVHLYFLEALPLSPKFDLLTAVQRDSEQFVLRERFFFLYAPEGIGRSKLAAQLEKALGVGATARNANTLKALAARLASLSLKS